MLKNKTLFAYLKRVQYELFNLRSSNFSGVISRARFCGSCARPRVNFSANFVKYNKLAFPVIFFSLSLWSKSDPTPQMPLNDKELDEKTRRDAIAKADDLFTANKHEEVCETLSDYKESGDVEVLWRMARSKYKFSSQQDIKKDVKELAICEGYDIICRALEIDNKHYAVHKWMSVLLDARSELHGMKERITQLEKVKEHMLEAVKLNPNDATTYHMLGSWCYQIADMAWYQRKIAATLFASPPTSTFQEALEYFKKAEEVQPNFYSQNLLMLGKTHLKLGEQERAHYYLTLTTEYLVSSDDDLMARKEAETLLQKLNYKKT